MIKYILVLVLFGFFNISLAQAVEEENWVSCVEEEVCKEINLDKVLYVEYEGDYVKYTYSVEERLMDSDIIIQCRIAELRRGQHCLNLSQESEEVFDVPEVSDVSEEVSGVPFKIYLLSPRRILRNVPL